MDTTGTEPNQFLSKTSAWSFIRYVLMMKLYRRLTRQALPVFLRGGDDMSPEPLMFGQHDPQVSALLASFAGQGYNGVLIDIGANIGLIACQSGRLFRQVVLYEPNPLCWGILDTNLAMTLDGIPLTLNRFGLGKQDERLTLRIPKKNWGGAFVVSPDNAYSADTLLAKDRFAQDSADNYLTRHIDIRKAESAFAELFQQLQAAGVSAGAVKIDVEGFEWVVLSALAATVPRSMKLAVVFEHWGPDLDAEQLLGAFGGRGQLWAAVRTPGHQVSDWGRLFGILRRGHESLVLRRWAPGLDAKDLVLKIDAG